MKWRVYPMTVKEVKENYHCFVPDFNLTIVSDELYDCIVTARESVGKIGADMIREHQSLPIPYMEEHNPVEDEIFSLLDVNFDEYL